MADRPVPVVDKRLLDVKLAEFGTWLGGRDISPRGFFQLIRSGYHAYYNKYINVKKGGLGGISMVLVGYVVLSYFWNYEEIKHERQRKYH